MIDIKYSPNDPRYIFIFTDTPREMKLLEAHLNKIPPYMFLPSFTGIPKPEVFLHTVKSPKTGNIIRYCHSGLWKEIVDFCKHNNIMVKGVFDDEKFKYTGFNLTKEQFRTYVNSWNLNLKPRDYQVEAAWLILKFRQSLSQLATRAGKTLIAYMVFRYMLEHGAHNILMVVPNVSLVKQGVGDFSEYQEFFKAETVWAGGQLCNSSNLTIGTFQSLVKMADKRSSKYNPSFFKKFDVVLIDECHTAKCTSINTILNLDSWKGVKIKFGFSGSLPLPDTIESLSCQSLLGPKIQDITSRELMDQGFITPIEIEQIRIHYDNDDTLKNSYIKLGEYICGTYVEGPGKKRLKLPVDEQRFLMTHQKQLPFAIRNLKQQYVSGIISKEQYIDYLVNLCKAKGANLLLLEQMLMFEQTRRLDVMEDLFNGMHKNCIVFAHHTEYLKFLESYFKEKFPQRHIYLITGSTSIKKRDKVIKELLENNDCILFASYGCTATGLTLKNIDFGIFAESFKSQIINKQAMGRGLCLANDKDVYKLYDLIDCFPTKRLLFQGKSKEALYKKESLKYKVVNI